MTERFYIGWSYYRANHYVMTFFRSTKANWSVFMKITQNFFMSNGKTIVYCVESDNFILNES